MTPQVKPSSRETRRLQTRERILGAAIAEFKRSGMAGADVSAIVAAAGVAHGTFYFHFPSKEHVLLELESREEARIGRRVRPVPREPHDLAAALTEVVAAGDGPGAATRPAAVQRVTGAALLTVAAPARTTWTDHPVIVLLVREIERARGDGEVHPEVDAFYSATFFLLGIYGVLTTTDNADDPRHDAGQVGRIRRPRPGGPMTSVACTTHDKEV